jgi:hypothetical protein
MPQIRVNLNDDLAEKIETETISSGTSRHKVVEKALDKYYSLALEPTISTDAQSLTVYTSQDIEAGFDSIIERQSLKIQLEEAQLQYQKLLEEHQKLKESYEISISITKIKTPWWIRFKMMFNRKRQI